jgi:hypothetical protein
MSRSPSTSTGRPTLDIDEYRTTRPVLEIADSLSAEVQELASED